jgi:hypothetical protein
MDMGKKKELQHEISRLSYELERVETSELPLVDREQQPPLVIDLPEGQKLVVGKLEEGTVIEVASWRGTGRPDSRTSRLMLGLSQSAEEISSEGSKFLTQSSDSIVRVPKNPESRTADQSSSPYVKTGVDFELVGTSTSDKTNDVLRGEGPQKSSNRNRKGQKVRAYMRRNRGTSVALLLAAALILVVYLPVGVSFARPRGGVTISLGSTSTSLVAYKRGQKVAVGDRAIANFPKGLPSPELVVVQAVNNNIVQANLGGKFITLKPKDIQGKVIAIFPYIGWPLSW